MKHWSKLPASPYSSVNPLPEDTQTWIIGMAETEPVIGLPTKSVSALTEMQAEQERFAKQMRELGETKPAKPMVASWK
jgi:hypothetical protein